MAQQVISNRHGSLSYGTAASVSAGATVTLCDFSAPEGADILGISLGLGISDVTAWNACVFTLYRNGAKVLTIADQISDLLRPEFIPLEVKAKDKLRLDFSNGFTGNLDAAALLRIEVIR